MAPYTYRRLEEQDSIRLAIIQPRQTTTSGLLCCEIIHVPLLNCGPFEALSYSWGANVKNRTIGLISSQDDGGIYSHHITEDLLAALKILQHESKPRTFWIDQISVDQGNAKEKSSQIHIMWKIYHHAQRTIIWLGNGSDSARRGMELSHELATLGDKELTFNLNNDLLPFLQLRWFGRLWVIQEVAFSKDPLVMLGNMTLPWEEIAKACSILPAEFMGIDRVEKVNFITHARTTVGGGDRLDLLDLLVSCRGFGCSEPSDRIKAIHGMISYGTEGEDIGRDYMIQDPLRLFQAFTAQLIEYAVNQKWPATLDFITHAGTRNTKPSWPSWVPDWTNDNACSRPTQAYFRVTRKKFNASAGFPMGDQDKRVQAYHKDILVLEGKRIDKVHKLCSIFKPQPSEFVKIPLQWEADAFGVNRRLTNLDFLHRFSRTLVADFYMDEELSYSADSYRLYWACLKTILTGRVNTQPMNLQPAISRLASHYYCKILLACRGQRFFTTQGGYFGLCPRETVNTDLVVVLYGGESPFILRPTRGGYTLIGDCYIDGVMYGEAVTRLDIQSEEFSII